MKRNLLLVFLMAVLAFSAAACGSEQAAEPAAVNPDVDKCALCNMAVKDDQHATQLSTTDGKTLKFDDLGCMNKWIEENGADKVSAQYVRDYNTKEWVEFDKAVMVYSKEFKTPMGYGIYSFKDQKSADDFIAQHGGEVIDPKKHHWKREHKEHKDDMDHSDQKH